MFGYFGFSYIGLISMLMLIIPNLIWTNKQPQGYSAENENKFLVRKYSIVQYSIVELPMKTWIYQDFLRVAGIIFRLRLKSRYLLSLWERSWKVVSVRQSEIGSRIRKDESYEKNYLIGKYGAIPELKRIDILKEENYHPIRRSFLMK